MAFLIGATAVACSTEESADGPIDGGGDAPIVTLAPGIDAGPPTDAGTDAAPDADGAVPWVPVPLACSTAGPGGIDQDLGHQKTLTAVQRTADRVMGEEQGGGWILWDVTTGAELAGSETGTLSGFSSTRFVVVGADIEMRATSDGHVVTKLPEGYAKYGVASDGSYAWGASATALKMWSPAGLEIASRTGNYGNVAAFAAPGELRIARGAAGANVIERVSAAGATVTGPTFGGTFHAWFIDGAHFLAKVGTTNVVVHDTMGALVKTLPIAAGTDDKLVGQNGFVWRFKERTPGYPLDVFAYDGDGTPVFSKALSVLTTITGGADTIGFFPYGSGNLTVLRLDPVAGVTSTSQAIPYAYLTSFGAAADGSWVVGTKTGSLLAHGDVSSPDTERSLGCGQVLSIAGAPSGRVAVATSSHHLLVADLPSGAAVADLPYASSDVRLSASGALLAAMATTHGAQYLGDRTVNVFALPGGAISSTFPLTFDPAGTNRFGFDFSANGARIATSFKSPVATPFGRDVIDVATGSVVLSDTGFKPTPRLSPNGERAAMSDYEPLDGKPISTRIYDGATLVVAVSGAAIGWLDDNRLLVQEYAYKQGAPGSGFVYVSSKIYDAAGALVASPMLPELRAADIIDATHVFAREASQLFDAYTGTKVGARMPAWNNGGGVATAAGPFLVGVFGRRLGRVVY